MIELLIAFLVGLVVGYIIKNEKQMPDDGKLTNQIEKLEGDVAYYKKLTKVLVEENTDMRTRLRNYGEKYD